MGLVSSGTTSVACRAYISLVSAISNPLVSDIEPFATTRKVLLIESPTPAVPLRKMESSITNSIVITSPKKLLLAVPPARVRERAGSVTPRPGTIVSPETLSEVTSTASLNVRMSWEALRSRTNDRI